MRQVKLHFADPRKSYTRAFERYALDLSRHMTIKAVAQHLPVSWDTIKDIQAASLKRRFGTPKLGKLKQIAIDEISIGKGHNYLTVVLDLRSGAVVFVGDGKGIEALVPFWKRLRASRAKIRAVATDMGKAQGPRIKVARVHTNYRATSSNAAAMGHIRGVKCRPEQEVILISKWATSYLNSIMLPPH